jgi:DNA-binding beta-propeller fold protein YncE
MTLILASGRWDNWLAVIDADRAMDPANDGTDRAVICRPRATPDVVVDGRSVPASGQPVNVLALPAQGVACVVCHSGTATPAAAAAYQHGHPGTLTVMDLAALRDPTASCTTRAIRAVAPTGMTGPVGIAATPDGQHVLVSCAEAAGVEDGGAEVVALSTADWSISRRIKLRVAPGAPPPCPHDNPHPGYGHYPNPNGIAVSSIGSGWLLTANGGTDDVSFIDLSRAMAGDQGAEVARERIQSGGFGITVSPDGRLAAVAARESMRTGAYGNTVSILSVADRREVARVRVGADDAAQGTRPFMAAWLPDGKGLIASCFASDTISLIDTGAALAGRPAEVARTRLEAPGGGPARPRGVAIGPGGAWAAVTGGAKTGPRSSLLWMVDPCSLTPISRVSGIGNETYLLDVLPP